MKIKTASKVDDAASRGSSVSNTKAAAQETNRKSVHTMLLSPEIKGAPSVKSINSNSILSEQRYESQSLAGPPGEENSRRVHPQQSTHMGRLTERRSQPRQETTRENLRPVFDLSRCVRLGRMIPPLTSNQT